MMKTNAVVHRDLYSLKQYLSDSHIQSIFLVCGKVSASLEIYSFFYSLCISGSIKLKVFSDFSSNPKYPELIEALDQFSKSSYDVICAIGGGSAMDLAKSIKAFAKNPYLRNLRETPDPIDTDLICIPTTAGSGAEATHFAVMYKDGVKYSVSHPDLHPDLVILEPAVLKTMPFYIKESSFLDALCHAVESYWSVYSNEESMGYSLSAIDTLVKNMDEYFGVDFRSLPSLSTRNYELCRDVQYGAYLAGQAINIAKTTAGHALSYKITSGFGIAHGYAVAMCLVHVWRLTVKLASEQNDKELVDKLSVLSKRLGGFFIDDGPVILASIFKKLSAGIPQIFIENIDYEEFCDSVNLARLNNHPVSLSRYDILSVYKRIFEEI